MLHVVFACLRHISFFLDQYVAANQSLTLRNFHRVRRTVVAAQAHGTPVAITKDVVGILYGDIVRKTRIIKVDRFAGL